MSIQDLTSLIEQVDSLILQHVNYLDRLEDAVKKRVEFTHKKPTECNFGKLFYSDVWPKLESFPTDIKQIIISIEDEHRLFHDTAAQVNTLQPAQEQVDATTACKLILKLYRLDELVKGNAR